MYLCADITALTEDTGFVPATSFEEGIEKTVAWFRTQN
jgi:nucleoside-diphosphate-sugar epimerase